MAFIQQAGGPGLQINFSNQRSPAFTKISERILFMNLQHFHGRSQIAMGVIPCQGPAHFCPAANGDRLIPTRVMG
jgi:hypothetical protein